MSDSQPSTQRLIQLVTEIRLEGPSEQRVAKLRTLLMSSKALCRLYVQLVCIEGHLGQSFTQSAPETRAAAGDDADVMAVLAALLDADQRIGQLPPVRFTPEADTTTAGQASFPRRTSPPASGPRVIVIPRAVAWLLAAVLVLACWIGWGLINNPHVTETVQAPSEAVPPANLVDRPSGPVRVGVVVEALDAQWSDGVSVAPGQAMLSRRAMLASGIVRLRMDNGVLLTLEGPCSFEPRSPDRVMLSRGKLVGRVPSDAVGFTVHAPGVDVVDLSTEFAICVETAKASGRAAAAMATDVLVLDGQVMLRPPAETSGGFTQEVVSIGQARRASHDGLALTQLPARPTDFYREVPGRYERTIRDLRPLMYWRFEEDQLARATDNLGAGGNRTRSVGVTATDPNGVTGRCLVLNDRGHMEYLPHEPLTLDAGFSAEAWVWLDDGGPVRQRILSNGKLIAQRLEQGFGFGVDRMSRPGQPYQPLLTTYGLVDFVGESDLPMHQWVHLAVTVDPAGVPTFYVDGLPVPTRVLDTMVSDQTPLTVRNSDAALMIGDSRVTSGTEREPLIGRIDEVAFYDRVLGPEELRRTTSD